MQFKISLTDLKDYQKIVPILQTLQKKVNHKDLNQIVAAIPAKRIGKLKEVWDKVVYLKNFVLDDKIKWEDKVIPVAGLLYVVMPIDIIPDIAPLVGYGDDAAVISTIFAKLVSLGLKPKQHISEGEKIEVKPVKESIVHDNILRVKFIISLMSHAAQADDQLDEVERQEILALVDYLFFSDAGGLQHEILKKQHIRKSYLQPDLHSYFEHPIPLPEILDYIRDKVVAHEWSAWYLYAYTIVNVDNVVKKAERNFLDLLAIQLKISAEEKLAIETQFDGEWLKNTPQQLAI